MFSEQDLIFLVPDTTAPTAGTGHFAKKVMVIVKSEPDAPGNLIFLEKVLAAVQIQLAQDTYLVQVDSIEDFPFLAVLKEKMPEQVLVFGFQPADLRLRTAIPHYQPTAFYGTTFIFADALTVLEPDRDKKTKLWQGLKALFT